MQELMNDDEALLGDELGVPRKKMETECTTQ